MDEHQQAEARRIGRLIAKLRLGLGWNQETLAHESGLSVSTVSRAERGLHEPEAENIRKLAKALKVKPALLTPVEAEVETQLDRIEKELKRQGLKLNRQATDLDGLVDEMERRLAAQFAEALEQARRQDRRRPPGEGRQDRA